MMRAYGQRAGYAAEELLGGDMLHGGVQVDCPQQRVQALVAVVEKHRVLHGGSRKTTVPRKAGQGGKGAAVAELDVEAAPLAGSEPIDHVPKGAEH